MRPRLPLDEAAVFAALAVLLALTAPAAAAEWSIGGFFTQRLTASDNRGFDGGGFGGNPELDSATDLGLSITALTPRARLSFAPGVSFLASTEESAGLDALAPRFNGAFTLEATPRLTLDAAAAVIPRFVNTAGAEDALPLDDAALDPAEGVERDVVQIAGSGRIGAAYQATARDSFSLSGFARATDYLDDVETLVATRSVGVNGGWTRALTPRTTASLSSGFTQFFREGGDEEQSREEEGAGQSVSLTGGVSHQVNERLGVEGSLGPSFTRSDAASGVDVGVVGELGATYDTLGTTYSALIAQTVEQDTLGGLQNLVVATASAAHPLNTRASLSLSARLLFENPLFDTGDSRTTTQLTIAPSYRLDLTEDWELGLGYRFVAREPGEGSLEGSNSVFFEISRGLSILP